jgi:hypothetical protein
VDTGFGWQLWLQLLPVSVDVLHFCLGLCVLGVVWVVRHAAPSTQYFCLTLLLVADDQQARYKLSGALIFLMILADHYYD